MKFIENFFNDDTDADKETAIKLVDTLADLIREYEVYVEIYKVKH
jgi:hypothetical protein